MWLFWLFEFLGLVAVLLLVFAYCRFKKIGLWSFIWQHLKWVSLAVLIVWLLIAIFSWNHLYSATQCYFRGVSMKANTKYSIYLGECQIETPRGSYIPIDRTRALPDGNKDGEGTNDDYYGY